MTRRKGENIVNPIIYILYTNALLVL